MSDRSAIEWTDATWNPIRARLKADPAKVGWHCVHKSEGCRGCYAERINLRLGTRLPYKPGHEKDVEIFLDERMLRLPLNWRRPRMIFPLSMTDLFAASAPTAMIDRVFAIAALTGRHTYQFLTKRPDRQRAYLTYPGVADRIFAQMLKLVAGTPASATLERPAWPLPNVWLGTSVEDQLAAHERVPELLATPAAVRWLSCEPLLGALWLWHELILAKANALLGQPANGEVPGLDWIVVGGESGPGARPMHPDWARSLRDQCAAAGVPFFFKQWGQWAPSCGVKKGARGWRIIDGQGFCSVGKKLAGRDLDGVEHNAMPEAQHG